MTSFAPSRRQKAALGRDMCFFGFWINNRGQIFRHLPIRISTSLTLPPAECRTVGCPETLPYADGNCMRKYHACTVIIPRLHLRKQQVIQPRHHWSLSFFDVAVAVFGLKIKGESTRCQGKVTRPSVMAVCRSSACAVSSAIREPLSVKTYKRVISRRCGIQSATSLLVLY